MNHFIIITKQDIQSDSEYMYLLLWCLVILNIWGIFVFHFALGPG